MYTKRLALACERLFDLNTLTLSESYYYASLPLCVIDAVFSIGVKYTSTQNAVRSYCRYFGLAEYQAEVKSNDAPHRISQMVSSRKPLEVPLRAHLRNSPPSLLIIGNNYLKQLAFGARARGLAAASQFALRAHPT